MQRTKIEYGNDEFNNYNDGIYSLTIILDEFLETNKHSHKYKHTLLRINVNRIRTIIFSPRR